MPRWKRHAQANTAEASQSLRRRCASWPNAASLAANEISAIPLSGRTVKAVHEAGEMLVKLVPRHPWCKTAELVAENQCGLSRAGHRHRADQHRHPTARPGHTTKCQCIRAALRNVRGARSARPNAATGRHFIFPYRCAWGADSHAGSSNAAPPFHVPASSESTRPHCTTFLAPTRQAQLSGRHYGAAQRRQN